MSHLVHECGKPNCFCWKTLQFECVWCIMSFFFSILTCFLNTAMIFGVMSEKVFFVVWQGVNLNTSTFSCRDHIPTYLWLFSFSNWLSFLPSLFSLVRLPVSLLLPILVFFEDSVCLFLRKTAWDLVETYTLYLTVLAKLNWKAQMRVKILVLEIYKVWKLKKLKYGSINWTFFK